MAVPQDAKDKMNLAVIYLPLVRCVGGRIVHKSYVCPWCDSNEPSEECKWADSKQEAKG